MANASHDTPGSVNVGPGVARLPGWCRLRAGTRRTSRIRWRRLVAFACALPLVIITAVLAAPPEEDWAWMPELAPQGPLVIVVSLPAQQAYVYRNGVRIGMSAVSTGKPGHDTPGGVYTILQKRREHHSNLYDDAPMPFMQRLTWDGVALHAGGLPGYPASHGCVRLPLPFAEKLFNATAAGTVVVIAARDTSPPTVTSPGLFAPVDATGAPITPLEPADGGFQWHPERAPDGPLTVLLSTRDRRMIVLRDAVEIGRAVLDVDDVSAGGTRAYVLLEGVLPESSLVLPDRPALRWLALPVSDAQSAPADLRAAIASGRLGVPAEFARIVYDTLKPGATVIVTDESLHPAGAGMTVLRAEDPQTD